MQDRLKDFRVEHSVDSPEALIIWRRNRVLTVDEETTEIDPAALRESQTARRNLSLANTVLTVANAKRFVDRETSSLDGSVPVQ